MRVLSFAAPEVSRAGQRVLDLSGRIEAFINFRQNAAMRLSGRDYYGALWTAKIVLDRGIDMAGSDRGNMRCFEARSSI